MAVIILMQRTTVCACYRNVTGNIKALFAGRGSSDHTLNHNIASEQFLDTNSNEVLLDNNVKLFSLQDKISLVVLLKSELNRHLI